jgi:hypothetical protein
MLSITECKKKLNRKGVHFNDREIEIIRNVPYNLATICQENIIKTKKI